MWIAAFIKWSHNFVKWCYFTISDFFETGSCASHAGSNSLYSWKWSLTSNSPFFIFLELQLQIRCVSPHPVYNVLGTNPKAFCTLGNFFTNWPTSQPIFSCFYKESSKQTIYVVHDMIFTVEHMFIFKWFQCRHLMFFLSFLYQKNCEVNYIV